MSETPHQITLCDNGQRVSFSLHRVMLVYDDGQRASFLLPANEADKLQRMAEWEFKVVGSKTERVTSVMGIHGVPIMIDFTSIKKVMIDRD